jgi:sigma-B regulation protein RsbU (phosphoserine phosphatase)
MEAAIPVVMFSGILDSQMEAGDSLEDLFAKLNRLLHRNLDRRTFICFTMGEFDLTSRTLRLSNSGCPYPYHYQAATQEVVELEMNAYPLGVRTDVTYEAIEVQLEPGDRVVFCSDGIVEATNTQEEMFSFEQTAEVIRQGCQQGLAAEALIEHIFGQVKAFTGAAEQGDDQTVVVLQVESEESIS